MNKTILASALFITIFVSSLSRAELIIYKGTEKEVISSENRGLPINWKLFVIVDYDTGYYARIRYAVVNGAKTYRTLVHTNTHIVQLVGADTKSYSAITRIPTDCEVQESPGSEGVSFKGVNASLKLSDSSTVMFPKVLSDHGIGLSHSSSGDPILDEGSIALVFSSAQTLASNSAGETLDIAFSRLVSYVQSLGY